MNIKNDNFSITPILINKGFEIVKRSRDRLSNLLKEVLNNHDEVLNNLKSIEYTFQSLNKFRHEYERKINNDITINSMFPYKIEKSNSINFTNPLTKNKSEILDTEMMFEDFDLLIERNEKLNELNSDIDNFNKSSEKIKNFKSSFEEKLRDLFERYQDPLNFITDKIGECQETSKNINKVKSKNNIL